MKAENGDVVGDKRIQNDKGELTLTDAQKHLNWKEHCERLLNEEFPWGKANLIFEDPVIRPRSQIDKEGVRELALTDAEKHLKWKEHYERLLNEEFPQGKENLIFEDLEIGPQPKIDKEGVKPLLTKMRKASGDAALERMTSLFNCILIGQRIPSEWDASAIVNCFGHKAETTDRGNQNDLKLLEHTIKI